MASGNETMPTTNHTSTMTGNSSNGYALITPLIITGVKRANNLITNSGFENGQLNEWLYSSNNYSYLFDETKKISGRYSLKMTTTKTHTDNQQAYQIFNTITGHIYYGTANINAVVTDTAKTLTRITIKASGNTKLLMIFVKNFLHQVQVLLLLWKN